MKPTLLQCSLSAFVLLFTVQLRSDETPLVVASVHYCTSFRHFSNLFAYQDVVDPYVEHNHEEKHVVDINVVSAVLFLVLASAFLVLLYYLMSKWFLLILVIIFCIGGVEVIVMAYP